MLGGGIADKLGNEYEFRWTLVEALRVLQGLADEIRLEPFGEAAEGLEFRITAGSISEWHQCKRRRSSGSWTIRNLETEGILQAFAGKLVQPDVRCVFVSSDPAPAFETLIEKARIAQTADDFYGEGGVGKTDRIALKELNTAWTADAGTQFEWLQRCRVEVVSDTSLIRRLQELCGLLFRTPPDEAVDRLIRFLGSKLGHRITTESLSAAITMLGIEWRAHFDEALDVKFKFATDEYLASLPPKIAGIDVQTADLDKVVKTGIEGDRPITLVAGGAGSGKSIALSRMIAKARQRGWSVLAFRIDRYLETQTLADLGRALLSSDDSPIASFGNRNVTQPSLLVIDQVDAVSEASGRSGRMRDLFFRMIEQSAYFPNMRVVAACRSYDLDRDTRLEELSKALRVNSARLRPLDWQEGVEPVLIHLGLKERLFTDREKQVLSVPINLQLFASIIEAGEPTVGEISGTRLFDKLMEVRERDIRKVGGGWTALSALGVMAQSMSDNQELTAPAAVLDSFSGAIDALNSLGLVTAIGRKLQFAHESFFDHTFSRHFIATGQSVHALLTSDEQRLFRRTQVRQIFSRLRDNAERRYLANLREVMSAGDVRYLVKDAIAYWLGEVDGPTPSELAIVEQWFQPNHSLEQLARVVFNGQGWLPILLESGALGRFVQQDGPKKELAFWLLRKWATVHSALVAEFLDRWWRADAEARGGELIVWFERLYPDGPIGPLEDVYSDVIAAAPASAINGDFAANFELGSWVHKVRL